MTAAGETSVVVKSDDDTDIKMRQGQCHEKSARGMRTQSEGGFTCCSPLRAATEVAEVVARVDPLPVLRVALHGLVRIWPRSAPRSAPRSCPVGVRWAPRFGIGGPSAVVPLHLRIQARTLVHLLLLGLLLFWQEV